MGAENEASFYRRRQRSPHAQHIPESSSAERIPSPTAVLSQLQLVYKEKESLSPRLFTIRRDHAIRDSIIVADIMGADVLTEKTGLKIVAYAPLDGDGKILREDAVGGYPIYVAFPVDTTDFMLYTNSNSLAQGLPGGRGKVDELVNNRIDLRPEAPHQRLNRYAVTIYFTVDYLLRKTQYGELIDKKYEYVRRFLEEAAKIGEAMNLPDLYSLTPLPDEKGKLVFGQLSHQNIIQCLYNKTVPIVFTKGPTAITRTLWTEIDVALLEQCYRSYQEGQRTPQIENGAKIYEILVVQPEQARIKDPPTTVSSTVAFDSATQVSPSLRDEEAVVQSSSPLIQAVVERDTAIREAGVSSHGDVSLATLILEKYRALFQFMQDVKKNPDNGRYEIQQGTYGKIITMFDANDTSSTVEVYVAELRRLSKQAKKGRTNIGEELLKLFA